MAHSNQIREFLLTDKGIDLVDVYLGPAGVLTGTARVAQEAQEKATDLMRKEEIDRKKRELERKRRTIDAQIEALHSESEAAEEEVNKLSRMEEGMEKTQAEERREMGRLRKTDVSSADDVRNKK
jgi:circadian clock protein KaiC